MRQWLCAPLGAVTVLMLAGCAASSDGGGTASGQASCTPAGTNLQVAAKNLSFDTDCLAAPADTAFTITFDNQDNGIPHDVAIYTDSSASTELFNGEDINGPETITYNVDGLQPGTYFFQCDLHPTQMTGTFVVQ